MTQMGFFDLPNHLQRLSEAGDPLEIMARVIDFEAFRPVLEKALAYSSGGTKGGRPPYDAVVMFKVLILAAQNNLSDERMEFLIRDRLSWLRFLGFQLGSATPDENTIRIFRERLTRAGSIRPLFDAFELQLRAAGYFPTSGQIVDATIISAPRQRNTQDEKNQIKAGKTARQIWPDDPARAAQKDVDARWTVKQGRAPKPGPDGKAPPAISIPMFGYKNHIGIDRGFGFIRTFLVTDAAAHDGARLREGLIDPDNTSSKVWADTAYRSAANEEWLAQHGKVGCIHKKKPKGKPLPVRTAKANAAKSRVRALVEHPFARLKGAMELTIHTIGRTRAEVKIGLANIVYNMGGSVAINPNG